jgi:hypothetical protein
VLVCCAHAASIGAEHLPVSLYDGCPCNRISRCDAAAGVTQGCSPPGRHASNVRLGLVQHAHKAREGQFPKQQVCGLLVLADFLQSARPRAVPPFPCAAGYGVGRELGCVQSGRDARGARHCTKAAKNNTCNALRCFFQPETCAIARRGTLTGLCIDRPPKRLPHCWRCPRRRCLLPTHGAARLFAFLRCLRNIYQQP